MLAERSTTAVEVELVTATVAGPRRAGTCSVCSARPARVNMQCCDAPVCVVCLVDMFSMCDESGSACVRCGTREDGSRHKKMLSTFLLHRCQWAVCVLMGGVCLLLLVASLALVLGNLNSFDAS